MKFRWISSNSRELSSKSSYILHPNRRYFKGELLICFAVHMKRVSNQVGEKYVSWIVDGKDTFLLIVFSLLHGSSDGNFRH